MTRTVLTGVMLLWTVTAHGQEPTTLKLKGWVGAVAFLSSGDALGVGTSDGLVSVWDVASGKESHRYVAHKAAVGALAASKELLVSGGRDNTAVVAPFRATGGRSPALSDPGQTIHALALTKDGKFLFTGSMDSIIRIWDIGGTGRLVKTLRQHNSWVNSLALNHDDTLLASGSSDNTLKLARVRDGEVIHTFRVSEGEIRSVAFSPNGKLIAAGIRYGNVRVWDVETKKEVASFKTGAGESWAVAFTPDGKTLAWGGGEWNQPSDVILWDVAAWKERGRLKHSGEVLCLAISPDGRFLAAGSWDQTVRIWDIAKSLK